MSMKQMVIEGTTCIRTLRLKITAESYPWLNAAAVEVNQVWNWGNATSAKAARPLIATRITARSGDQWRTFTYESISYAAVADSVFDLPPAVKALTGAGSGE
jgi:hypothetical protein